MRQALGPGALGEPRGSGWRGKGEGGSGWGTHVNPWLIHVNVWQKPLQYCKVISIQLIQINEKKKKHRYYWSGCGSVFPFKLTFIIVALQCCISFYCTAKGINRTDTHISHLLWIPPQSGHQSALRSVPQTLQHVLIALLSCSILFNSLQPHGL